MEIYGSFGGGMVTQAHTEKLRDDQSVLMENVDVIQGGVVQSRGGYSQTNNPSVPISGISQGTFRYKTLDGVKEIVAINGKLYTVVGNTYTLLPITGLTSFQATRSIEAVQLREKMYFATGSGLVTYDGTTAAVVSAYAPNGLEALYIGTNGYASDPDNYLSDTTGAANVILGVTTSMRYAVSNEYTTFTAYVQKVVTDTLEYRFETKNVVSADYVVAKDWNTSKNYTTRFTSKGEYAIRVSLRKQGETTVLSQYVIPKYKVNTTPDENPEPTINHDDLKLCNRIFIHYDRLFIYGDTGNPDFLYVSHLDKFNYFPRTNIIPITDPLRGKLQSVKQYKNFLVCFTDASIQMITGKNPTEFEKSPVHTTIGAKYPYSVQVMKNYIAFVGNDDGVYILKSFNYSSNDKLNIERIDENVRDVLSGLIKTSTRILSCIYDNQYYLYIENPDGNYIYRFYYELGVWVRDKVSFSFRTLDSTDNIVTTTSLTGGTVYKLKDDVHVDGVDTLFNVRITSKDYNFDIPHHRKKLKQYQLIMKMTELTIINADIYADDVLISSSPLSYDYTQKSDNQKLKLMASGRFRCVRTDLSVTVYEKIQLIGFCFVFKQNTPK